MYEARIAHKIKAALVATTLAAALFLPSEVRAAAGGVQDCTVSQTCVIGEFLYDDSSSPINVGATCTITSRYPDDTLLFDGASMTAPTQSDGWYSKTFTAPSTTGFYRTTVSCTVSGDTLSIDKSFQVNAASATDTNAVAAAVWGYSNRTVSSFGTLVSDIWSAATRTLTGESLSSGKLATQSDVTSVRDRVDGLSSTGSANITSLTNTTNEIRLLLEQVVNKPVIQNVLEESGPDLSEKINGTKAQANQVYVNSQFLTVQSAELVSKWGSLSGKDALDRVLALESMVGSSSDSSNSNSMFGSVNWVRDSWDWDEAESVHTSLSLINENIQDLKSGLANFQKSPALLLKARSLVKASLALEGAIGSVGQANEKTLFGKIKETEVLAKNLDQKSAMVDKVLAAYTKSKDTSGITDLQSQVLALNKIPGATSAITRVNYSDPNSITNNLLGLRGILSSNKKYLSTGPGKTMINVWLEIGSIVFKTLATNPSKLISQTVEVKYYLPQEIKKEDIMKTDAGLSVEYDAEKDQLYVTGSFSLAAGETRSFSVETKDIWDISDSEVDSLRKQAEELYKPLEKTAYYAQAVTLKSDINANLDQIAEILASATTPEEKIRAYRQSDILKKSVDTKIAAMKDLVGQASAAGSLFGFVGGAQTIAVWGLILVIAAGFIFLTIYMRTITSRAANEIARIEKPKSHSGHSTLKLVGIALLTSVVSASGTAFLVGGMISKNYEQKLSVLGTQTETKEIAQDSRTAALPEPNPETKVNEAGIGGPYLIYVNDDVTSYIKVRQNPDGEIIGKAYAGDKFIMLGEEKEWYKVQLEDGQTGYVSSDFTTKQ